MHRYTPEQKLFLKENCAGRGVRELVKMFNKRFRIKLSYGQIKASLKRYGLKTGYKPPASPRKYFEKHVRFLENNFPGKPRTDLLVLFNRRFGTGVTLQQLKSLLEKYRIKSGRDTRFRPGQVPSNGIKKGFYYPGCERTWFKKGHLPHNSRFKTGDERVNGQGYVQIKISETALPKNRRWKMKHLMIWEKANGRVPEGNIVVFLDNNKQNCAPGNLATISRTVHAVMCRNRWYAGNAEITGTHILMAKLKVAAADAKRGTHKTKKREAVFLADNGDRYFVQREGNRYKPVRETPSGIFRLRLKRRNTLEAAAEDLCRYARSMNWQRL